MIRGVIWQAGRDWLKPEALGSHPNLTTYKLYNLGKNLFFEA